MSPAGQSMILRNASTHSAALTTWGAATCLLTMPELTAQALIKMRPSKLQAQCLYRLVTMYVWPNLAYAQIVRMPIVF